MKTTATTTAAVAYGSGKIANIARRALLAEHGIHSAIPASIAPELIRGQIAKLDRIISVGSTSNRRTLDVEQLEELLAALAAF